MPAGAQGVRRRCAQTIRPHSSAEAPPKVLTRSNQHSTDVAHVTAVATVKTRLGIVRTIISLILRWFGLFGLFGVRRDRRNSARLDRLRSYQPDGPASKLYAELCSQLRFCGAADQAGREGSG